MQCSVSMVSFQRASTWKSMPARQVLPYQQRGNNSLRHTSMVGNGDAKHPLSSLRTTLVRTKGLGVPSTPSSVEFTRVSINYFQLYASTCENKYCPKHSISSGQSSCYYSCIYVGCSSVGNALNQTLQTIRQKLQETVCGIPEFDTREYGLLTEQSLSCLLARPVSK